MAEFSKQWCELNQEEGIKPDFDIVKIARDIPEGHYKTIICEGFGFIAIGKENGKPVLGFWNEEEEIEEWKTLEQLIKEEK